MKKIISKTFGVMNRSRFQKKLGFTQQAEIEDKKC